MYFLFTDFGLNGPYIGQMTSALQHKTPQIPVINLMVDAPAFNISASATLLYAFSKDLPHGSIIIAVVDPGVGSGRGSCVIKTAKHTYIGPDNGLFDVVVSKAPSFQTWQIITKHFQLSRSFHGRDLFAPVATMIQIGNVPPGVLHDSQYCAKLKDKKENEIVYVDGYGNLMTNILVGELEQQQRLELAEQHICYAHVFSAVEKGQAFWYENSSGLIEVAVNQGSAAQLYNVKIGDSIIPVPLSPSA